MGYKVLAFAGGSDTLPWVPEPHPIFTNAPPWVSEFGSKSYKAQDAPDTGGSVIGLSCTSVPSTPCSEEANDLF